MRSVKPFLPWTVWGVATLSYGIAVVNRASLAALGPAAQEHFGIDATTLSIFVMIQLAVYAGMQIPVGMLLDRIGSSRMILSGMLLMVVGQTLMATVSDVRLAILARVLVGAGDACTFTSLMRMLPDWFSVRQLPVVSQLTGLIGQAGQLVSITPLAFVVSAYGWASGFLGVAGIGLLVGVLGALVLRDRPGVGTVAESLTGRLGRISREARSLGADEPTGAFMRPPATELLPVIAEPRLPGLSIWTRGRRLLSVPGTRLAYWMHFTSPFALTVFVLLWGTPFLTGGIGLSTEQASGLLNLVIVASMAAGLLLGPLSSRFVEWRVTLYLVITFTIIALWIAVIVWPTTPPLWLIIVLVVAMPFGGPASMIAFEVARSHTPRSFSGFGTGLVNTGGFTSALCVVLLIGLALDLQGAGSPEHYSLRAFQTAFAVQIPFWLLGVTMILIERARTKRWMEQHGRRLR